MRYALILAGGSGLRAGGDLPKQFQKIDGIPMLWYSVRAFFAADPDTRIRLVMHPGYFYLWDKLHAELPDYDQWIRYDVVSGGSNRLESVKNGLIGLEAAPGDLVAVHDAARPGVSLEMITRGWLAAKEKGSAVPVVPMIDSIRKLEHTGNATNIENSFSIALDRSEYVRVQTPQIFDLATLIKAYDCELTPDLTDDASVMEKAGHRITLYTGEESNIKVTNPIDFEIASILMKKTTSPD